MDTTTRKRLFTLIIIPLLLIPTITMTYAHLTNSVVKKYKLHISVPTMEIGSYKLLSKYDDDLIKESLEDNTLTFETKVFPEWYAWIGLILHNGGDQPVQVDPPYYDVYDPNNIWQYFIHIEYFYGPYNKGEFATADPKVWDGLKWWQLPPNVTPTEPPITLDPCHKLVLWIKLKFTTITQSCCPEKFKIRISICIPGTPNMIEDSSWTWPPP